MRRTITGRITVVVAIAAILLAGCSNLRDINVSSADIVSVSVSGLRTVNADLSVKVDNPARKINVYDTQGAIFIEGKKIGGFSIESFSVPARFSGEQILSGRLTLSPDISPFFLMSAFKDGKIENLTVDISGKAGLGKGKGKKFHFKDIPLSEIAGMLK